MMMAIGKPSTILEPAFKTSHDSTTQNVGYISMQMILYLIYIIFRMLQLTNKWCKTSSLLIFGLPKLSQEIQMIFLQVEVLRHDVK